MTSNSPSVVIERLVNIDLALRTMITAADALCVQASERDRDRAAHLTARFNEAHASFIAGGGDPSCAFVGVLIRMVEQGKEWRGQVEREGEMRLAA